MVKDNMRALARKLYVSMQIEEMLPMEEYEIFIKPEFNTASWRFYENKHQIVIGEDIFNNLTVDATQQDKALYMRSFLYHEFAHSIWTHKNLKEVNEELIMREFTFELFNLFEDARIEDKMRQHTKKYFSWLKYEELGNPQNPVALFFYIVQSENRNNYLKEIKLGLDINLDSLYDTVYGFYKQVIQCESYMDIIKVMSAWYKRFPQTPKYIEIIKEKAYLFSQESDIALDEKGFNQLIEGLENMLVVSPNESGSHKGKKPLRRTSLFQKNNSLLSPRPISVAYDEKQRNILLSQMKKLFLAPKRDISTTVPSKKFHIKNLVAKNEKIFKRKERERSSKKKITIILDLSSSMHATMGDMHLLLDVLNTMAKKSLIDVTLILSGVYFGRALYEKFSMPLEEETIRKIVPRYEAEGLYNSMSKNLDVLKKSDYVWIFTDGFICEGELDKSYFHQQRIKTHAFYIGEIGTKEQMEISFDHVVCEKNVMDLASKIFTLVK